MYHVSLWIDLPNEDIILHASINIDDEYLSLTINKNYNYKNLVTRNHKTH